eukprot:scaffold3995_cov183-Alexandrium_tamarense.AAC.2
MRLNANIKSDSSSYLGKRYWPHCGRYYDTESSHLTVQKDSSQSACDLIDPTAAILRGRTTSPTYNSEL